MEDDGFVDTPRDTLSSRSHPFTEEDDAEDFAEDVLTEVATTERHVNSASTLLGNLVRRGWDYARILQGREAQMVNALTGQIHEALTGLEKVTRSMGVATRTAGNLVRGHRTAQGLTLSLAEEYMNRTAATPPTDLKQWSSWVSPGDTHPTYAWGKGDTHVLLIPKNSGFVQPMYTARIERMVQSIDVAGKKIREPEIWEYPAIRSLEKMSDIVVQSYRHLLKGVTPGQGWSLRTASEVVAGVPPSNVGGWHKTQMRRDLPPTYEWNDRDVVVALFPLETGDVDHDDLFEDSGGVKGLYRIQVGTTGPARPSSGDPQPIMFVYGGSHPLDKAVPIAVRGARELSKAIKRGGVWSSSLGGQWIVLKDWQTGKLDDLPYSTTASSRTTTTPLSVRIAQTYLHPSRPVTANEVDDYEAWVYETGPNGTPVEPSGAWNPKFGQQIKLFYTGYSDVFKTCPKDLDQGVSLLADAWEHLALAFKTVGGGEVVSAPLLKAVGEVRTNLAFIGPGFLGQVTTALVHAGFCVTLNRTVRGNVSLMAWIRQEDLALVAMELSEMVPLWVKAFKSLGHWGDLTLLLQRVNFAPFLPKEVV